MANFMFKVPNLIVSGEGSMEYLSQIEGEKAIIVTGGSSMKIFGFIEKAQNYLCKAGIEALVIDDVEPNTLPKLRNKAKFIAIPSTSGTGSEISGCSVITDTTTHAKYPIVSAELIPDVAILDMELPAKMPKSITAHTGMDVMSHALEAYVSIIANPLTDPLAVEAIRLVIDWLPKAYENGEDMEARDAMHHASTIAGMSFNNASLGIVHSLAHSIGGQFGITHGLANAILLPYVIEYNRKITNKYDLIENRLGIDDISETIKKLNETLDIPSTFNKLNIISEEKFKEVLIEMSQNAFADACTGGNPRETSQKELAELYKNAYYGR